MPYPDDRYPNFTKFPRLRTSLTTHDRALIDKDWYEVVSSYIEDIVNGGALPAGIQGNVLYHNGSAWATLTPGTDGFVLGTHGAAANPEWVDRSTIPAIQKNHEFRWTFKMVDSMDFATPKTGKTPVVTISKDGAAFGALTGAPAVTEIGNGWYYVDVPATDMNIDAGVLKAIVAGCAQTDFAFYPQA